MRRRLGIAMALLAVVGINASREPVSAVDFGRWGVVVLQSDDWGVEGWIPDLAAADAVPQLTDGLPERLRPYATSTLESADRVDSLVNFLAALRDADGLPAVIQANTIMAGIDLRPSFGAADSITVHPSGQGEGRYFRPGLPTAVDRAIEAGVWWPELHGLTHYDLEAYAEAVRSNDPSTLRAAEAGVVWYPRLRGSHELGHGRRDRALATTRLAVSMFRDRFGRDPVSVVAPDYRWDGADQAAWREAGLRVVQAKREQVDPGAWPGTWPGRVRKVIHRWLDVRRAWFVYLDRPVRLEPYGDASLSCEQGAEVAVEQARRAWDRGLPAVVSIHRLQLVNLDSSVEAAGEAHLRAFAELVSSDREIRFLLDDEVEQLFRRGISVLDRGSRRIIRNYSGRTLVVTLAGEARPRVIEVGTHVENRP